MLLEREGVGRGRDCPPPVPRGGGASAPSGGARLLGHWDDPPFARQVLAYELAAQVSDFQSPLHRAKTTRNAAKALLKGRIPAHDPRSGLPRLPPDDAPAPHDAPARPAQAQAPQPRILTDLGPLARSGASPTRWQILEQAGGAGGDGETDTEGSRGRGRGGGAGGGALGKRDLYSSGDEGGGGLYRDMYGSRDADPSSIYTSNPFPDPSLSHDVHPAGDRRAPSKEGRLLYAEDVRRLLGVRLPHDRPSPPPPAPAVPGAGAGVGVSGSNGGWAGDGVDHRGGTGGGGGGGRGTGSGRSALSDLPSVVDSEVYRARRAVSQPRAPCCECATAAPRACRAAPRTQARLLFSLGRGETKQRWNWPRAPGPYPPCT